MNTSAHTPPITCPRCQQQTPTTAYCAVCGQKKYESRFTWTYIVTEILSSLNFEKGILFNFKVLWKQPTTALQGYLAGRTKLFYPPWQYFSVACALFFFLLLAELTAMMGVNANDDAEKAKLYYQEVYDNQYKELAIFLQDSLLSYQNIDSIKNTLQKKGKELHDIRWLENDEDRRAKQQATFVQWFSYIGFYFFPFYLAFFSIFFFKKSNYYFTEHLIIYLFLWGQIIFILVGLFVIGWAGKAFFRFIEDISNVDTDTFVALWQVGLIVFTFFITIRYIQKVIQGLFEQTTLQSYIKTALLLSLSGGFTAVISFVVSEGLQ